MKRKYAAMALGLVLTVSSMNVYAAAGSDTVSDVTADTTSAADADAADVTDTGALANDSADENAAAEVIGQVTSVGEDNITIDVGALKNHINEEKPEENAVEALPGENEEKKANSDSIGEDSIEKPEYQPLIISLTGEEETISVTEETVIVRELAADETEAENAAEAQDASTEAEGENAEAPTDETAETAAAQADVTEAPADEADDAASDLNEVVINAEAVDGSLIKADAPTEEIGLADIIEGDVVVITLDEDGNAALIAVMPQLSEEMQESAGGNSSDGEDAETAGKADTTDKAETTGKADTADTDEANADEAN